MKEKTLLEVIRPFVALYASVFFLLTAIGLLNTYLSLRLSMAGVGVQTTGLIMTVYFLGLTLGALVCSPIIRQVGHIRAFSAFAAVSTAAAMVHGMCLSVPLWTVLRFISGLSNMGLYMVIESWLNECADARARGRVFAIYMTICYIGGAIGQKMLDLVAVETLNLYLAVGLFMVLSIIPISLARGIHPEIPEREGIRFSTICRKTPIGLIGTFTAGLLISGFYAMAPVFAHQIHLDVSTLSWFMALAIVGGFLFQGPMGAVSDRLDRSLMLPGLGLVMACASVFIPLTCRESVPLLLGASVVFGGIMFSIYPVSVARAHDMFEPKDVIRVSTALLMVYGVGSIIGPVVSATVMDITGSSYGLFYYFTGCAAIFGFFSLGLRRLETVEIIPPEEQVEFVIMKNTSPVAMHMDPRQDDPQDSDETP